MCLKLVINTTIDLSKDLQASRNEDRRAFVNYLPLTGCSAESLAPYKSGLVETLTGYYEQCCE